MSLLRSNLLNRALTLIPGESFQYLKFKSEQANSMGVKVPTYEEIGRAHV